MIAVDDLRAVLRPEHVIAACAIDARQRGRAWRLRTCPGCGAKPSRQGAAIYARRSDGRWCWTHHGHDCGGDLLDLVAVAEGIDRRRDLPRLIDRCAQLAGITPSDPDLERRIAEQVAADRARLEQEDRERSAALAAMPASWDRLARRSVAGEKYLDERGLTSKELLVRGVVRFAPSGELALAMRHLETGEVVGIQYRTPGGKGFRMETWSASDESALAGMLSDLDPDGVDVAVIVEGLADTLAAQLAFPGCAVYGAAGADHMDTIAEAVARRVRDVRGWLLVVVDDDETGVANAAEALAAAAAEGLVLDRDLHLVDLGEHHDLADAWRAGWRWTWPQFQRAS